jgi:uncharacterized protein (UPF0218 family)
MSIYAWTLVRQPRDEAIARLGLSGADQLETVGIARIVRVVTVRTRRVDDAKRARSRNHRLRSVPATVAFNIFSSDTFQRAM